MAAVTDPQKLLVLAFLLVSMLGIGLRSGLGELTALIRDRGFLTRALVANFVLVPLLGIALARTLPLPPHLAGAIILLACVPGGVGAVHFTAKVKGKETAAAALFAMMSVAAVLVSPWLVAWALPAVRDLNFPHGRALAFVVVVVLVPIATGIVLHERASALAKTLSKIVGPLSVILFIAFSIASKNLRSEAFRSLGWPAVGAMALLFVGAIAAGWLLGGPERPTRRLLAITTSMRNTAVCMLIAERSSAGMAAMPALVAFSLLMSLPYSILSIAAGIGKRRAASRAKASGAPGTAH